MTSEKSDKTSIIQEALEASLHLECDKCCSRFSISVVEAATKVIFCFKCKKEILTESVLSKNDLYNAIGLDILLLLQSFFALYDRSNHSLIVTREVVLNANCALEMKLKKLIRSHLIYDSSNEALINLIMERVRGMEDFDKLLKTLRFKKPHDLGKKFKKIRDLRARVVHGGYTPSFDEAQETANIILSIIVETKPPDPSLFGELLKKMRAKQMDEFLNRVPFEGGSKK